MNLGATGLRVSRVCLGMMSYGKHESRPWTLEEGEAEPILRRAVEGGITFFDTADVYNGGQSEIITGGRCASCSGCARSTQIHRWDPQTPIAETTDALHDVVKSSKACYIGASSIAWQFAKAQSVAATRLVSMQNHYNLVYREEEREMIPLCLDQGVGVIPRSPLARALLAGNRTKEGQRHTTRATTDAFADSLYTPDVDFGVVDRAGEVAAERGVPAAQSR